MSRVIVHLDADAFFASVEQAADPLVARQTRCCGRRAAGHHCVSFLRSAKFGVYTPMPTARARRLCPRLVVLLGDFERYEQFSNWMFWLLL